MRKLVIWFCEWCQARNEDKRYTCSNCGENR